jgi:formylglycine-generating enzyme required for sulfatase activity
MKAILIILILCFASACSEAQTPKQPVPTATPLTMKTETKAFTNSIGMEFVAISAGSFMMGASESDRDATSSEKPQHKVAITKPFSIGKYEVTQKEWEAVMGSNPYTLDRSNPYYNLPGMAERITRPDHPATVSWNDAQEFIKRLNAKEKLNRYRLPTEAEWEYAARAGTTTAYSFGDNKSDLSRYAWHSENFSDGGTHPVGQKQPNPWGLYDIHGNAWEWVQDRYSDDYYAKSPAADPKGPDSGNQYVVRGGSWHVTSDSWRSSFRKPYAADYRGISIGFRLVMMGE